MKEIDLYFNFLELTRFSLGIHIQTKRPFLVKRWQIVSVAGGGFTIHLCPLHFYITKRNNTRFDDYKLYKNAGCSKIKWTYLLTGKREYCNNCIYCD